MFTHGEEFHLKGNVLKYQGSKTTKEGKTLHIFLHDGLTKKEERRREVERKKAGLEVEKKGKKKLGMRNFR